MANELIEDMTPEERQFFESGGETPIGEERPPVAPPEGPPGEPTEPTEPTEPGEPQKAKKPHPRIVPVEALIEERRSRQAAEARMREYEAELQQRREIQARIEERIRVAQEQRQAEEEVRNRVDIPDPNEDPLGYERARREQLERRLEAYEQNLQRSQQEQQRAWQEAQQREQISSTVQQVQAMTHQYAMANPDYYDALAFMQKRRDEELQMLGMDPQSRGQVLQNEAAMIVQGALARGENPAKLVHQLAKRWGFNGNGNGNGTPLRGPTQNDRVSNMNRGQTVSRSLSDVPGVSGGSGYTLERLADMRQDDFDALYKKDPEMIDRLLRDI